MTFEEFKEKVLEKMREPGYCGYKSEAELKDALKENEDILTDGYRSKHGVDYGIGYAAWNISMCI